MTDDGKSYEVSVVDAGIPTVFIEAKSLDMSGIETPQQIEGNAALMTKIEEIRAAAVKMGFTDDYKNAVKDCPYARSFAIVSEPELPHLLTARTSRVRTSTSSAASSSCRRCIRPTP